MLVVGIACGSRAGEGTPSSTDSASPGPASGGEIADPGAAVIPASETIVSAGVEVTFSIEPRTTASDSTGEGNLAEVRFSLRDSAGAPFAPESAPAVWIDRQKSVPGGDTEPLACTDKVGLYVQGLVGFRPDIDLNSYFILALNNDPTISVIDPLLEVGGITQLYSMILLDEPGEDWVQHETEKRLFVTMPAAGQVAVADTDSFKVLKNVDAGTNPMRISLQPDGRYVWVGNDSSDGDDSGVTVIDTRRLDVLAEIETGSGHHEIAFADDSSFAFVTNSDDGTMSIVDARSFEKVEDIEVGDQPVAVGFSDLSDSAYVASGSDGTITVFDGKKVTEIESKPGIRSLRFAPGGRWGFVVNGTSSVVEILDATTNSIIYSVDVPGGPDKVSFTHDFAYVHAMETAEVSLIDLAEIGRVDKLPTLQIIGGQNAPASSPAASIADVISPIHEHGGHVLIANPADNYVYFYMEGMKAPMGGFTNYSRAPRAVGVIDRSIREEAPGEYSALVKLPEGGSYQAAFLLDDPRIIHCFDFAAEWASGQGPDGTALDIELLSEEREVMAGDTLSLRFALTEKESGEPATLVDDVQVLVTGVSGSWNERYHAKRGADGVFEASFPLPNPGLYNVRFAVPTLQAAINQLPSLVLTARAPGTASPTP